MVRRRLNIQRLMQRLAEMNLTVEGFKATVGLDRRTIERLLSGKTQNAQYQTIAVMAQCLGLAPRDLLLLPDTAAVVGPPVASSSLPNVAVRLPVTGSILLSRSQELEWLDRAWSCGQTNIVSLVAWGGVGKSALVNHWLGTLARNGWHEGQRVFGWTFSNQGLEDPFTSADGFLDAALHFCGDPEPRLGTPWDKGRRLAQLLCTQRTLLVLDGFETLQHPPGLQAGQVQEPAMAALLQALALHNPGLCVITTRLAVADIAAFQTTTAAVLTLACLPEEAGGELLQRLGCAGSQAERCAISREYGGHALTLQLLGSYVRDACGGDIRRRQAMAVLDDWSEEGQARSVMESYERWFGPGPETAILRLVGLFDGLASAEALEALRTTPLIPELNKALSGLQESQWLHAIRRLRSAGLLAPPDPSSPYALDTHPLIRAYYRQKLRTQYPAAWRAGHDRLFAYLQTSVAEACPGTMEGLVPLYTAVAHGCLAGRVQEALHVLRCRIRRGEQQFSIEHCGAFSIELATLAQAFTVPWSSVVPDLSPDDQRFLFYATGECLSALGRVHEAAAPLQRALTLAQQHQHWESAALTTTKLSEVARAQGDLTAALRFAELSTAYVRRPGVPQRVQILSHAFYGFALYWVGKTAEAQAAFQEAEQIQQRVTSERPILHAALGYMYSELLLDQLASQATRLPPLQFREVWEHLWARLTQALTLAQHDGSPRDIGLQHTSMGRLYTLAWQHAQALGLRPETAAEHATTHFAQAVACLHLSNYHNYFPRALLSRATLFRVQGCFAMAHADVDAALALARSSVMDVYQVEAYLEKASLFLAAYEVTLDAELIRQAVASLNTARTFIHTMGYYRRSRHLAELETRLQQIVPSYREHDQ